MSDLAATNCGCGCDNNGCNNGCGCSNWIWIILLLACCGNGNGCGSGYGFGNDSCCWIILLLLFCGNGNNFLGCGNGCGNGCGCRWQLSAGSAPRLFLFYKNCFFSVFHKIGLLSHILFFLFPVFYPLLRRSCFLLLSPHTILIDFIKRISIYNNLMHTLTCCFSSILTIFHLGGTGACRRADSGSKICLGNI